MPQSSKSSQAEDAKTKDRRRDRFVKSLKGLIDDGKLVVPPDSSTASPSVNVISTSSSAAAGSPNPPLTIVTATKQANHPEVDILDRALEKLERQDRDIIQPHINTKNISVLAILDESLAAVKNQQSICDNKRWALQFGGHPVVVKDKVDKIAAWINRFKATGDLVAAVDPIHVGLPWAGIKLLLEASVAEANQMAALLAGCEVVLYMANRLKVYVAFLAKVPSGQSQSNLEEQIVQVYACLFEFLAKALQIYQQSSWKRNFQAFWDPSDVTKFEEKCKLLGYEVENEASNADRTLAGQDRSHMKKVLEELEQLRSVQASLQYIEMRIDLGNLKFVKEAPWDAYGQVHQECHSNTRVQLMQDLQDWACRSDSRPLFWLQGAAGTGKSTISYTLARWLSDRGVSSSVELGASFFFKRGEGDRGSALLLFPTIAHQLARRLPGFAELLAVAVKENPDVCSKRLGEQYPTLIQRPLSKLRFGTSQKTYIIVIDALDECDLGDIDLALQLWSRNLPPYLKLFVTGRAEPLIKSRFDEISASEHEQLVLQSVPEHQVYQDILTFLTATIRQNRQRDIFKDQPLEDDWPGDKTLQDLTKMAVPLFVVAATISRFIEDPDQDPLERLEAVISSNQKLGHCSQMAKTYLPVLEQFGVNSENQQDKIKMYEDFQVIIGSIITLAESLSILALAELLEMPVRMLSLRLRPFFSVLQIPPVKSDAPVRPLHLSFAEFLTGDEIEGRPFSIDSAVTHGMLMDRCLDLLSQEAPKGLCENMCDLGYPGQYRQEIKSDVIHARFSPAMQYACRHWTYHAQHSGRRFTDIHVVHGFLQKHFLHWLEALSFLGCITDSIAQVESLGILISDHDSTSLTAFIKDARRFVLSFRFIIDLAPLQVYSSAIIFSPQESVVRSVCGRVPDWILHTPRTSRLWGPELQQLEGHTRGVYGIAFSPRGEQLASVGDKTVRFWNVATGQEIQKITLPVVQVTAIAFSPNGSQLAAAGDDKVWMLDAKTGQEVFVMLVHTDLVDTVVFSADGGVVASVSHDGTVRLWDAKTGVQVQLIQCGDSLSGVAFVPGGNRLASVSRNIVRLWDTRTAQEVQVVEGQLVEDHIQRAYIDRIDAIAFSHDGSRIALEGMDVNLWNIESSKVQARDSYYFFNPRIAFSPDGTQLVTPYVSGIRLWDVNTGQVINKVEAASVGEVVWAPDGRRLATASALDTFIRLWDVEETQDEYLLQGHDSGYALALAFSSDGKQVLTISYDKYVILWDVSTGEVMQKFEVSHHYIRKCERQPECLGDGSGFFIPIAIDAATSNSLPKKNAKDRRTDDALRIADHWVVIRNHKLLWLPPAYRPRVESIRGDMIALARHNGVAAFLRLRHP